MKRSDIIKLMTLAYQQSQLGGNSETSDEERMEYILEAIENNFAYYTRDCYGFSWKKIEYIITLETENEKI